MPHSNCYHLTYSTQSCCLLGAPTLQLCPLILPFPLWLTNWGEPRLQHLSASLRGHTEHLLRGPGFGGEHWHMLETLRVWCPSREPCPCGMLRLAPQGVRATTASFSHLSSMTSIAFSLLPDSCASGGRAQLAVVVNRPEPISQREHLILCALAKAEPTSPASRLAAEACREGKERICLL